MLLWSRSQHMLRRSTIACVTLADGQSMLWSSSYKRRVCLFLHQQQQAVLGHIEQRYGDRQMSESCLPQLLSLSLLAVFLDTHKSMTSQHLAHSFFSSLLCLASHLQSSRILSIVSLSSMTNILLRYLQRCFTFFQVTIHASLLVLNHAFRCDDSSVILRYRAELLLSEVICIPINWSSFNATTSNRPSKSCLRLENEL